MEHLCKVIMAGTACMDEYFQLSQWIPEGDKIDAVFLRSEPGGMIPNAACVLAGLGIHTCFFDTMNPGPVTKKLLGQLEAYGVDTSLVSFLPELPDARCFICQTPKERTVIAVHSPKPPITLSNNVLESFFQADYFYTTLFNLQNFENPIGLLQKLKYHDVKILFDIENHTYSELDRRILNQGDILFFNEYGFKSYCHGRSPDAIAKDLINKGVENITVTLGSQGCQCYTGRESFHIPGFKVSAIDPTGAGDTFNAAFLYGIVKKFPLRQTAVFANAAAALAVTADGPKGGDRPVQEINSFIQKQKGRSNENNYSYPHNKK